MLLPATPVSTIIVRERGQAPTYNPANMAWKYAAWFDVAVVPKTPITIGQRVKMRGITGVDEGQDDEEAEPLPTRASDLGVEGYVEGIRTLEKNTAEFVVKNEIEWSMIELVYLTVELTAETVALSWKHWAAHKIISWTSEATRRMPAVGRENAPVRSLEEDAE